MKSKTKILTKAGHAQRLVCDGLFRLSAQELVFQPELTHSVWTDFMSRARTQEALEKQLRKGVRSGEYVGYRLHRIEAEYLGITWRSAAAGCDDFDPETDLPNAAGEPRPPANP